MVDRFISEFGSLEKDDFRTLRGVEEGMKTRDWVPVGDVSIFSGLPVDEVEYRLSRLGGLDLVVRRSMDQVRFRLDFGGYDVLALNVLVSRGVVDSLGGELGVGKEAEVRSALMGGSEVVLKFHREGKVNFRGIRRSRDYLGDREHFSKLYIAKLAAEREYRFLKRLYGEARVPEPYSWNRHLIAMEKLKGNELSRVTLENDPEFVLDLILDEVEKTFKLGVVHGDLSEYNIIIAEDELKIIDWPQAVETDHQLATKYLKRDIKNVVKYFKKKYKIDRNPEEIFKSIVNQK
ncbi:RIO-like serine/threonine protein kinase fused to N-terminal HTH domain [Methanonatronarchaeum thermophilum]|uniref:non-specific serine/threonine protein kinase n=1 Tax=Methanonatronarchaeum thermophilum TaxID=1927129 RepID=A0A1Y3GDJ6_9EURY|nr:RIO1 family regulatory kinase/ATPase [Methanonatronarchaeum thermophilum]OUJ19508.1 RIO-like serine/threonine protein kinase fused to N-terminal HTH domain [Methanonatronarchaeum thermophilum]